MARKSAFRGSLTFVTCAVAIMVARAGTAQPLRAGSATAQYPAGPAPTAPLPGASTSNVAPAPYGAPVPTTPMPTTPMPTTPPPSPDAASAPLDVAAQVQGSTLIAPAPVPVQAPTMMPISYSTPMQLPACTTRALPSPCLQPRSAYRHDGLYLRISTGTHYTSFTGDGKSGDVAIHGLTTAPTLAIGGTPGEGVVVAGVLRWEQTRGTVHGAPKPEGNGTATLGELGILMDYFPRANDGWHFGGLLALGVITVSDSQLPDSSGAAFAGSAFGGYDWWIGPEWSLGLMAMFTASSRASLKDSDRNDSGYSLNALSGGLDVTFTLH
ncbi:MAG TPA: hypothetical protein VH062_30250 [Polyangiaceae bacterium]|nr:hypothetical protein [Polyangiaceae bacterium]